MYLEISLKAYILQTWAIEMSEMKDLEIYHVNECKRHFRITGFLGYSLFGHTRD